MPEPLKASQRYMPGLDGLRAIAVLAVIAYHLGFSWAPGGLLGVGVFFTLSGYLITDLLLAQLRRRAALRPGRELGTLGRDDIGETLGSFWLRRARRLLPALFLMLAFVAAWVGFAGPAQPAQFREAVAAAALYVANWQLVLQHVSYFSRFGPPSPLGHLWSLGVEEQFYILWPLLLLLGLRFVKEASDLRPRLAGMTLLLAGASALEMALLYRPGFDPSRVYYGTDTRAFGLLIGAALAMVWPSVRLRKEIASGAVSVLDGVGGLCLVGIFVMFWRVGEYSPFLYEGGFVVLSFATAVLVATLAHPASRLGGLLGRQPLRWIGERSYGIYLWHFPIIVLTTPAGSHGVDLPRAVLQVAATFAIAALSWRYVEQPIRRGALGRLWRRGRRARRRGRRPRAVPRTAWTALAGTVAVFAFAGVGLAGASLLGKPSAADDVPGAGISSSYTAGASTSAAAAAGCTSSPTRPPQVPSNGTGGASRGLGGGLTGAPAGLGLSSAGASDRAQRGGAPAGCAQLGAAASADASVRSSCRAVIHIGDSTSEGLISTDYLPDPKHRIEYQYARVGVRTQHYEIAGARSIVERYEGQPNAYEVAKRWKRSGYHGCWVLALGTNDAADVAVGSHVGMRARIGEMMSVIGDEPVMWVNVKTLLSSGPYAEKNMSEWDETLVNACAQYPSMRVFDWAALVKNEWFIADGIHYTTPGYAARARDIAQALATAFPEKGDEPACEVQ